ncbi:ParB family chromosome partitioning protein [Variovorax sp. GrIS 2.14]|uniref:ParB/RepB/Spo0J family partition protein n=1 Tax=Variovorax sp. GrIS 2.14 TaxID=3071709 RepID=UPI0038F68CB2
MATTSNRGFFDRAGAIEPPESRVQPERPSERKAEDRSEPRRARTSMGSMAAYMERESESVRELDALRERFDGASATKFIDPRLVAPSEWANRHEDAFATAAFSAFREEIQSAGGNIQPVRIRRIPAARLGEKPANAELSPGKYSESVQPLYEIVYGHRRHRACLELGLPLLAQIDEEMNEQTLFTLMERENRGRQDLSAWEQGVMYTRALSKRLFPTRRALAASIGLAEGTVSKAVSLAELPDAVIAAFASPLDIQFRFAADLNKALQIDPDGVLSRAKSLAQVQDKARRGDAERQDGQQVLAALTAPKDATSPDALEERKLVASGKVIAKIRLDRAGRTKITLMLPLVAGQEEKLDQALKALKFI